MGIYARTGRGKHSHVHLLSVLLLSLIYMVCYFLNWQTVRHPGAPLLAIVLCTHRHRSLYQVAWPGRILTQEDVTNVIAALRHHNRVCKIYYRNGQFQDFLLKEFAAIDEPFPALTSLQLLCSGQQNLPVLPDSFLDGSAPCLRTLRLAGISYPSIGKLLSSTTNLVRLSLLRIPHSGYIAPETIIPCLSMLPWLQSLMLEFQDPQSRARRASRHSPPLTRVVPIS